MCSAIHKLQLIYPLHWCQSHPAETTCSLQADVLTDQGETNAQLQVPPRELSAPLLRPPQQVPEPRQRRPPPQTELPQRLPQVRVVAL